MALRRQAFAGLRRALSEAGVQQQLQQQQQQPALVGAAAAAWPSAHHECTCGSAACGSSNAPFSSWRAYSAAASSSGRGGVQQQQRRQQQPGGAENRGGSSGSSRAASSSAAPPPPSTTTTTTIDDDDARMRRLMRVLLQPISRSARWHPQLSPHLVDAGGQLLADPSAALASALRALHVVRGVLREGGHVYVLGNNALLRPLLREAARACLNPNMWWCEAPWKPGAITNAASHRRLFRPEHQPNRRLFLARGLRLVNPHCPAPQGPPPRLGWDDKWALHARSGADPEARALLRELLDAEQRTTLTLKPPRTLPGAARALSLLVALDATRNAIALSEAAARGIPTIALASGQVDAAAVTYPVVARDFSPAFVHFFLDLLVRVANVAEPPLPDPLEPEPELAAAAAAGGGHSSSSAAAQQ